MSTIKIRYVAQVEIDMEVEREKNTLSLEEIKQNAKGLSEAIKKLLYNEFAYEGKCNVKVTEMYRDVTEFEESES